MPLRRLVLIAIAGAVPLILALAGLFLLRDADASPAYRGSRPPSGMQAADFRLRNYTGREVALSELRDNVLVLTRLDAEDRGRVAFVAISTDPREDTPAAVRSFLRRYGAEGTLEYLIGPEGSVRRAWQDYGVLASEVTGSDTMHSAPVRIYAPGGEWVSSLGAGADLSPRNLAHDIEVALDTT
jgi:cytochrome oxidase Cu insertion factor (SCO1/SenC/PrrC family)